MVHSWFPSVKPYDSKTSACMSNWLRRQLREVNAAHSPNKSALGLVGHGTQREQDTAAGFQSNGKPHARVSTVVDLAKGNLPPVSFFSFTSSMRRTPLWVTSLIP